MKILSRVFALAALAALGLINTGCSKEEAAEPAAAATAAVEVETAEAATETAESSAPATETLEVVEESAAVAEPEDRAIVLAQADADDAAVPRLQDGLIARLVHAAGDRVVDFAVGVVIGNHGAIATVQVDADEP